MIKTIYIIFDKIITLFLYIGIEDNNLPVSQCVSSYPGVHVHMYLLTSSVHVPPFRHGRLAHSSISKTTQSIQMHETKAHTKRRNDIVEKHEVHISSEIILTI